MRAIVCLVFFFGGTSVTGCTVFENDTIHYLNESTTLCTSTYLRVYVRIDADNVTFDCNGSTLDGVNVSVAGTCIRPQSGADGSIVKNCIIKNYEKGYEITFTDFPDSHDYLINNTFELNEQAIDSGFNDNVHITGNTFVRNDAGIELAYGDYWIIEDNDFIDNEFDSVDMGYAMVEGLRLVNNRFINHTRRNQAVVSLNEPVLHSVISGNDFQIVNGTALAITSSAQTVNVTIDNNTIRRSISSNGIRLYAGSQIIVSNNLINDTYYSPLTINGPDNLTIVNNTITGYRNETSGIYFLFSNHSSVSGNRISGFEYPITLSAASHHHIYDNIINESVYDISVSVSSVSNTFNTTRDCGRTNIIGGPCTGGNYWTDTAHSGFSDTCNDVNTDGFCDSIYNDSGYVIDYLPLSLQNITTTSTTTSTTTTSSTTSSTTTSSTSTSSTSTTTTSLPLENQTKNLEIGWNLIAIRLMP